MAAGVAMAMMLPSVYPNQDMAFFCLTPVLNVGIPPRRNQRGHPKVVASQSRSSHFSSANAVSLAAVSSLFWASPALASSSRESPVILIQIRNVYMHILRALKSANDLLGVFSVKLFAASEVGLRALNPFCNSIVSLLVQLSKCVVDGLILPTEKSLQSLGYDTRPTVDALKMFSLAVKQTCKQLFKVLETLFPNISPTRSTYLIRATGIFVAIYLLVPFVIQMLAHAVRGYKGELSALQALDMVLKRGYLLIDIRTEKEKFKSGIPSLPQNVMNSILFVPIEDLSLKFKGQLRDYRRAEAEVAAIKISFLRRINKSSKLVILDRYGDVAKLVARSLTRFGFRNSWVITDGFDGGRGWVQSRLSTAPRAGFAQMFSPTRLISEGAKKIFPSGRDIDITPQ